MRTLLYFRSLTSWNKPSVRVPLCPMRLELCGLTSAAHISKWNELSLKASFMFNRQWGFCRQILCGSHSIWRWSLEYSLVFYFEERPALVFTGLLWRTLLFHSPRTQHKHPGRPQLGPLLGIMTKLIFHVHSVKSFTYVIACILGAFGEEFHPHCHMHLQNNTIKGDSTTKWILSRK